MSDQDVRTLLEQALSSVSAALDVVQEDADAATDDLLAARLLISAALVTL